VSQKGSVPRMFLIISVASVLVVCLGLRAFRVGGLTLWVDEVLSLKVPMQDSSSGWLHYLIHDANPPLSYLILKGWLFFGDSVKHLRMLPILFSALALLALFFVGRSLSGFWVGIFASALFAVHPFAIYYGRELRHPAISSFLALLVLYAFVRVLRDKRLVSFALYFVSASLLLWTHYYAGFLIASHLLLLLFMLKGKRVEVLALGIAIALSFLPWLGVMKVQWLHGQPRAPLPLFWEGILLWVFYAIGGSEWEPASIPIVGIHFAQPKYFMALFILTLPMLIAFVRGAFRRDLLPITASLILPVIFALATSIFHPVFRPKYFFMYFPFFCILVASGLFRRDGEIRAWLAWPLFIVLGLSALPVYYGPEFERERWDKAAKLVESSEEHRCAVAFYSYYPGADAFKYYYRGGCSIEAFSESPYFHQPLKKTVENWVRKLASDYDLVWLVDYLPHIHDPEGTIKGEMTESFREIDPLDFRTRRFNMIAFVTSAEVWKDFFRSRINFVKGLYLKAQLLEGVETGKPGDPAWFGPRTRLLLSYENEDALFAKLLLPYDLLRDEKIRIRIEVEGETIVDRLLDRSKSSYLFALLPRRYDKRIIEVEILFDRTIVLGGETETKKSVMVSEIGLKKVGCEVCR